MKLMGYELPLGISISGHSPEAVADFASHGFRYFEVGIPACPADAVRCEKPEDIYAPESIAAFADYAGRGREAELVEERQPIVDAIFAQNLRVWSVHLPFGPGWDIAHYVESERDAVCESLKRIIALTAKWGAKIYVLHGCLEPVADAERPVRVARSIRSLRELNEYAAKYGARVALENLPRTCLANSSLETRAMAQAAGDVPICFDVNHLLCEDHDTFLDALAEQVVTTHLSDYHGRDECHWLPGEGVVPWTTVVRRLMEAGYRGPFLFELRRPPEGAYDAKTVLNSFMNALNERRV